MRLIQGDCLEVMPELVDEGVRVDLILTDPPYGTTRCKWDNIIPLDKMWECINDLTNNNTPILLFGSEPFSSYLRTSNIKNYRYDWIWLKNSTGMFLLAKKMPMKYHELISVFYRKLPLYNPQFREYSEHSTEKSDAELAKTQARRRKDFLCESIAGRHDEYMKNNYIAPKIDKKRGAYPKNEIYFKIDKNVRNGKTRTYHPTVKPVPLLEYLIKTYTNKGDFVLDFTMGSGSTGVACLNTGRDFIGIELDKNYFQIASDRIKEEQKQSSLNQYFKF